MNMLTRAAATDSFLSPTYVLLAWANIRLGRRDSADSALKRLNKIAAPQSPFPRLLQITFTARFDPEALKGRIEAAPPHLLDALARAHRFGLSFEIPEAQRTFGAGLTSDPNAPRTERASGFTAQGLALIFLGRFSEAFGHLDSAAAQFATSTSRLHAAQWRVLPRLFGIQIPPQHYQPGRAILEELAAPAREADSIVARAAWVLAMDDFMSGLTDAADKWARRIEAAADTGTERLATLYRAFRQARLGNLENALQISEPLLAADSAGQGGDPFARATLHLLRGDWFEHLERWDEAERAWLWYENSDDRGFPTGEVQPAEIDWALGVLAGFRRGMAALDRGNNDLACEHLSRVAQFWEDPDPILHDQAQQAKEAKAKACRR